METKTPTPKIEDFVKEVEALKAKMLEDNKGYMLLAYEELDGGSQANSFSFNGKISYVAECLYSCMKTNELLANVIIAAANALVQNRMLEAQMMAETSVDEKDTKNTSVKKRRTKKIIS
jgi:hypothetical protein